ncbi:Protein of unknown function, partial [Gryllus bimaculatus]
SQGQRVVPRGSARRAAREAAGRAAASWEELPAEEEGRGEERRGEAGRGAGADGAREGRAAGGDAAAATGGHCAVFPGMYDGRNEYMTTTDRCETGGLVFECFRRHQVGLFGSGGA